MTSITTQHTQAQKRNQSEITEKSSPLLTFFGNVVPAMKVDPTVNGTESKSLSGASILSPWRTPTNWILLATRDGRSRTSIEHTLSLVTFAVLMVSILAPNTIEILTVIRHADQYSVACTVSPCRHHFTHFKRLRENRGLRARTGNNPMEFGTVDWVRDDRGAPFLRWVMPPGNGHLKSEGWAKQRRPGNAPDSQHAILTQAEGDRLRAEILRVQRETSQFYVDRYRERQAQQESQNADEDDRKGLELGGEGSGS
jgi:hypothetical protein